MPTVEKFPMYAAEAAKATYSIGVQLKVVPTDKLKSSREELSGSLR